MRLVWQNVMLPLLWATVAMFVLLVAYVLSVGPASYLMANGYLDKRFCVVYRPIGMISENNPELHDILIRYQYWWQRGFQ